MNQMTTIVSSWKPLFVGADAAPYRDVVHATAESLELHPVGRMDNGKTLLHFYLAQATGDTEDHARAQQSLTDEMSRMEADTVGDALHGGIAGAAWLAAHIDGASGTADDSEYEEVDAVLLAICRRRPERFYDVISGWVGFGVYFLERLPAPAACEGLHEIARTLRHLVQRTDGGMTWYTPAHALPGWQRALFPEGYHNIGLAHGVAGIVAFLAEVQLVAGDSYGTQDMLDGAAHWLLAQRLEGGGYASWKVPNQTPTRARLAWCYGELGVSAALLSAGRALRDGEMTKRALAIASDAAQRRTGTNVRDAGLCHGAAGNAHIFNRLHQATGDDLFLEAACHWFNVALSMRIAEKGIAGYRTWGQGPEGSILADPWRDDPAFLTGAAGIALAMLAAITPIEPKWDRLLLTRIPPRNATSAK